MKYTFYEFYYRHVHGASANRYAVEQFDRIPAAIRPYAIERTIEIPDMMYNTKGFDALAFATKDWK